MRKRSREALGAKALQAGDPAGRSTFLLVAHPKMLRGK